MADTNKLFIYYNPAPIAGKDIQGRLYTIHAAKIVDDDGWWDWDSYILLKQNGGGTTCVEAYWAESTPIPGKGIYGNMVRDARCIPANVSVPQGVPEVDWDKFFDTLLQS